MESRETLKRQFRSLTVDDAQVQAYKWLRENASGIERYTIGPPVLIQLNMRSPRRRVQADDAWLLVVEYESKTNGNPKERRS
jgi:hypothetical protein